MAGHRADSLAALMREALSVPAGERSAWLRSRCAGDAALAQRLRDALPTEPGETPAPSPLLKPLESIPESARRIGPYTLRGVLGEGTFGVVYLAEQREPIPRRVALKVLKPQVAGREILQRFDRERRLLARLDHPGIAHVLDAGVADDGRPWFAVEFVRGLPLLRHCDEARLSIEARVRLFEEICRAVHHAHQCGVLHRDLKPGNILVSTGQPGDGTPVWGLPKVIDFGIAEALGGDEVPASSGDGTATETPVGKAGEAGASTSSTGSSAPGGVVGTLEYMSPEQALGRDLDPRSDVFALGAILHHMLVGAPPLGVADEAPADALEGRATPTGDRLLDFVDRIRNLDPLPPSEAVKRLPPDERERVAKARSTTPSRLVRQLRGDLDWIVAHCLAKDRSARYDSAADLAADLRRHLAARPIDAAPPDVLYRLSRFVKRHQRATVATVISIASLLLATVFVAAALRTTLRAHHAERMARLQAERASAEASDALGALLSFITRLSLDSAAEGAAASPDELLAAAREELIAPFREQPRPQAEIRMALAKAMLSLDHPRAAEREITAAIALLGTLGEAGDAAMIEALRTQAAIAIQRERFGDAATTLDRAFDLQKQSDPDDAAGLVSLWFERARLGIARGDGAAARRALVEARRAIEQIPDPAARRRSQSSASFFEAQALLLDERWEEALAAIEPNLAFNRATMPGHWWVAESRAVEAAALIGMGQVEQGRSILSEVESPLLRALPPGSSPRRVIGDLVARALASQGLKAEAERWRALAIPLGTARRNRDAGEP
ncbi:MAG: protein kinase [Phycisphaeraceae bacterium]|nr:protein kinase [Phycisphaeraceae bacterium]